MAGHQNGLNQIIEQEGFISFEGFISLEEFIRTPVRLQWHDRISIRVSMTILLMHTVAHSLRHFLAQNQQQPH